MLYTLYSHIDNCFHRVRNYSPENRNQNVKNNLLDVMQHFHRKIEQNIHYRIQIINAITTISSYLLKFSRVILEVIDIELLLVPTRQEKMLR